MFSFNINDLLPTIHQLFDEYRSNIYIFIALIILLWLHNKFWINRLLYTSQQLMHGKTVVITGGNSGLGYETAKDLLQRGARVIIVCRNMDKGRQALTKLHVETECLRENIRLMECDLSSLDSVRNFARLYNAKEDRLDVLICNAGLIYTPITYTKDGFNYVFQSNYLGHFLLTNLLLNKLKKSRPSRVINVSSSAHTYLPLAREEVLLTDFKTDELRDCYCPSKACQVLSSYKFKQDLREKGINVFALYPGWVWTSLQDPLRSAVGIKLFLILYPLLCIARFFFAKTPFIGARTIIYCAVEPTLEHSTDLYFENCAPAKPHKVCTNQRLADRLWKLSYDAVGL